MPRYVVSRLAHELDHREGKGLKGARILVIGLAYKRNIDDTRESPSFKLIELLEARGARCEFHDPYVPCVPSIREHPELKERKSVALDPETLSVFDAVLIATDHDVIDYVALAKSAKLIIDTRNACARAGADLANVIKA
jgi:UDP-N-acetyl-D-glucosamine dehydrogenase